MGQDASCSANSCSPSLCQRYRPYDSELLHTPGAPKDPSRIVEEDASDDRLEEHIPQFFRGSGHGRENSNAPAPEGWDLPLKPSSRRSAEANEAEHASPRGVPCQKSERVVADAAEPCVKETARREAHEEPAADDVKISDAELLVCETDVKQSAEADCKMPQSGFEQERAVLAFLKENGFSGMCAKRQSVILRTYPLHCAVSQGLLRMTELLLKAAADPHQKNSWGQTPLDIARKLSRTGSYLPVVEALENAAALTAARKASGNSELTPILLVGQDQPAVTIPSRPGDSSSDNSSN